MSTVAQIFRQAESLKSNTTDSSFGTNEAWVSRQKLQDLYQRLLVVDLEYSLDKKVEQDLWNHVFKNQINAMQTQAKDRQNAKRAEIQASLNLFLETSSGFYLQLLQELCSAFKLDLPFRRRSSYFGILREPNTVKGMKMPKKSSSMYICQYCLVHLGDIARYRQQIEQAQTYYRHAAFLVPYNGQPYNQLAILEAAKGSKLSTVFYYVRSLAVKHPFPVAATNLEKFYSKITKELLDIRGKLTMSEIIAAFLQFHAFVHLCTDLVRAQKLMNQLLVSLPSHITSMSFSSHQFIEMIVINLFAMYHAKKHLEKGDKASDSEERCYNLVLQLTVSLLDNLLHSTPKNNKAREYHTLPAIKLIMDWLRVNQDVLSKPIVTNSTIWPCASKLFNHIQHWSQQKIGKFKAADYEQTPLPEDTEAQCFQPVVSCYKKLDFTRQLIDNLPAETETQIRCHRLVDHGIWVCDEFPSLNLLNYQKQKNGYHQFSAPTAHVKLLPGDSDKSGGNSEKKSTRQNVAIQAILQHKASQPMKQDTETNQKEGIIKIKHSGGDQHGKNQAWPKHVQILAPPHSSGKVSSQNSISRHSPQLQAARNTPQSRNSPQLVGRDSPNVQQPPKQTSPQLPVGAKPQPGLVNVPSYSSAQVFGQKMPLANSTGQGSNSSGIDFTGIQVPPPHLQQPQGNKIIPLHMQATQIRPQQQQQRMLHPVHPGKETKPQNDIGQNFESQNQTFNIFNQGFGPLLQEGGNAPRFGVYPGNPMQNHTEKNQIGMDGETVDGWSQFPWQQRDSGNQQQTQYQRQGQKQTFPGNQQQFLGNQNLKQQTPQNQVHFRNNQSQMNPHHPLFIGNPMPVQPVVQQQFPGNPIAFPGNQLSANPIGSRSMLGSDQRRDSPINMNQNDQTRFSMAPGSAMTQNQRGHPMDMSALKMPPPNVIGISGYPHSAADFARLSEGVPKPDSPLDALPRPMFPSEKQPNVPGGATYSLFSQSPWSMAKAQPPEPKGYGMMQGYSQSQDSPPEPGASGPYAGNNLQSLWSSGPSPLEKLLEQQKQQRQSEPH